MPLSGDIHATHLSYPYCVGGLTIRSSYRRSDHSTIVNRFTVYGVPQRFRPRFQCVDDHRKAFGKRVRELRHEQELSQEELAHRAGMHWTYISAVERGQRNLSIVRLAQGLHVSLATLFSGFTRRIRVPVAPQGSWTVV